MLPYPGDLRLHPGAALVDGSERRHVQGGMLVEEGLNSVVVALLAAPDAEVGRRQAGRARSTIASASTDGGSIP